MDYTLAETHEKMKQFLDKMGSDYFPLPVILNFFETATLDFIGENLKIVEETQTVTDDIRTLIPAPKELVIIEDPNSTLERRYIAALPDDYLRRVAYSVFYSDGSACRRADLLRHAEYESAKANPNRMPTRLYPIILQEDSFFRIDSGPGVVPSHLKLTYCTKPKYAETSTPDTRIVNLPDDAIEKILLKTTKLMFAKTADERTGTTYQLEDAFRKVFK